MRECSRCAGWAVPSAAFGGSGRLTCVEPIRPRSAQPATSNAKSAGAISRRAGNPDIRIAKLKPSALSDSVVQDLDLLGTCRIHPRTAPLLYPSPNPYAPSREFLRLQAGGGK